MARDQRIDAYIQKSADFAKPILTHLRETIHGAVSNADETIKWGMPFFMYNGRILCSIAAFKEHCALRFWNGSQVVVAGANRGEDAMGQFGRIKRISDLPSKQALSGYMKRAMDLQELAKSPRAKKTKAAKPPIPMPPAFRTALGKNRAAKTSFEELSPSHRREYLEWITEAKTDATRDKRIATTLEWISEGKSRNWKYEKR